MAFYRRRLPHIYETQQSVFLTWRLYDSLPLHRAFPTAALNSGQAFDAMDRLLDEARTGAFYLRQPAVADMIVEAIQYNAITLGHYVLHSFVVMPNHVHLLATPAVALPKLTKSLKGITAKRANAMLGLTGKPFWQEESYDHLVRQEREFGKIRNYIEGNPVRAGLVREASEYRWSSAGWAARGSAPPPAGSSGPRLQCGFMRQRSTFRNGIEYGIALGVVKSLEWAPAPLAYGLARGYTRLLDLAIPRLRRVAEHNLSMALPGANRSEIIDGVFRSIARLLVTFAKFPSIRRDNVDRWIRWEGREHFDDAIRAGRGVLFATAHLGNWELSAYAHALLAAPMHVVVRPLDNPLIDALVERRRALSGNRPIFKKDFARAILKALAANEAVGILADQNASLDSGVFVDFFGVPACASTGFAKLAAHSGAAVIPGFALWSESERRYVLKFYPPVPMTGDVTRDTQAVQKRIEDAIREYPGQWLWIHRRWKTRP